MPEIGVDDVLKLIDGLKEKGIVEFKGLGLEFSSRPVKKDKKVGKPVERKHGVDIALENAGKQVEDDE